MKKFISIIEYICMFIVWILVYACIKKILNIPQYEFFSVGNLINTIFSLSIYVTIHRMTVAKCFDINIINKVGE